MVAMLRLRMTMVYRDDDDTALIKSLQAVRLGEDADDNDDDDEDGEDNDDDDDDGSDSGDHGCSLFYLRRFYLPPALPSTSR